MQVADLISPFSDGSSIVLAQEAPDSATAGQAGGGAELKKP
jgi:hypothetical protein